MSNDPNDEIIDDNASLKVGVAKKIVSLSCSTLKFTILFLDKQRTKSETDGAGI